MADPTDSEWMETRRLEEYALAYTKGPALSPASQARVVQGLVESFPSLRIADFFRIKRAWFAELDHLFIAFRHDSQDVVGILASRWCRAAGVHFLQVSILLIAAPYQRTALIKHLWRYQIEKLVEPPGTFPTVIAYRTYNPVAFTALRAFARLPGVTLYPRIEGEQDVATMALAVQIAHGISPGLPFDPETGVIKGAGVPRDFYPTPPLTRRADVRRYFSRHLAPGDRLLCLLRFDSPLSQARLFRTFGLIADPASTPPS